jgi:PAS domain S-box-containing protein
MTSEKDTIKMSQNHSLESLFAFRKKLLNGMLIALSILGLPAVVVACLEAIELNQIAGVILYIVLYFLAAATTMAFNRLPFVFCVCVMLGSLYMISIFNLVHFSFSGAGIEIFITITVLATVLQGIRGGLVTGSLCLVSMIGAGLSFAYGMVPITPEMPATTGSLVSWITAGGLFILLAGTLVLGSGMLQQHLISSIETVQHQANALSRANEKISEEMQQRSAVEEKLKQSEYQFKTLFEIAPDAIYLNDREGNFIDGNAAAETLMGMSREEFIGNNFLDLGILPHDEAPKALDLLQKNIQGQSTGPDEITLFTKNTKKVDVEIRTCPFQMNDRPLILGIARDVSERKRLHAQLNQAQKMESVGRLAGGVAHDFNNKLGVILGYVEFALEKIDENHDLYSDLKEVQSAAKQSADITKQLLAFARKQTISPRQLNLNDTVEKLLTMLRRLIGEDIDLVWKPSAHLWPVKMDPSQIDQILANLNVNARDAIDGVGRVTIETGRKSFDEDYCNEHPGFIPGDFVLLAVSDNGCGMDKTTLDNMFEPFFTTKELGKGTGLGLATIYGIVKQNNGFINVYSEPGQGSTFKIYLPRLVAEEDTDKAMPEKKIAAGGTETILLVEDEPSILRMSRMMLERKGYSVLPATTPGEAIDLAKTHADKIHLLMTDVVMPEMNGRDLAGQITDLYPDIQLLFMSGYTSNVIAHQGVLDDGVAFIQKPFSMADMTEKIRELLDMASDKNQG